jgi:stage V sporulation protein SpoVS
MGEFIKVSSNGKEMGVARAIVHRIKESGYVEAQAINEAALENTIESIMLASLLLGTHTSSIYTEL